METKFLFLSGLLVILFSQTFGRPSPDAQQYQESCDRQNITFQEGESLKYSVYYNWTAVWIKAGVATFDIASAEVDGKTAYHFIGKGRTSYSYDWVYKVRDTYESFVDPETMKPLYFLRDIQEGGYKQRNKYAFDHLNEQGTIEYRYVKDKLKKENEPMNITRCTQDVISAVYNMRCVDHTQMEVGETVPIEMVLDGKIYDVHLRFIGLDTLNTDLGTFRCAKFSPLLLEGDYFSGGEEMIIWATDDENRLPIMIESPIVVGHIKAYLTDFSGLRHDLSSKL